MPSEPVTDCCRVAWLTIPASHAALPGHFPAQPVVPGVLLLAHVQALLDEHLPNHRLRGLPSVKFLQPLLPEQTALLAVEVQSATSDGVRVRFIVRREGQWLAQGTMLLAAVP